KMARLIKLIPAPGSTVEASSLSSSDSLSQSDDPLQQHGQSHQHESPPVVAPDETTLSHCMTMVLLLRLLLLEEPSLSSFSAYNARGTHYGTGSLLLSADHHSLSQRLFGMKLTISEIHALQTQRQSTCCSLRQQEQRPLQSQSQSL